MAGKKLADMLMGSAGGKGSKGGKAGADSSTIVLEGVPYAKLLDLQIVESAGSHGHCQLRLQAATKTKPEDLLKLNLKPVTVKAGKQVIFRGIVTQSHLDCGISVHELQLSLHSLSWLMDIEYRTRTFQNSKKKLSTVLQKIIQPYNTGAAKAELTALEKTKTIKRMLYQHDETDWQFLQRLAAEQGQLLFTDTRSDMLRVSIGCTAFKKQPEDKQVLFYSQQVSPLAVQRIQKNTDSKARSCYYLDTLYTPPGSPAGVGQTIKIGGREQVILTCKIVQEGENRLRSYLGLRNKEGCRPAADTELAHWRIPQYLEGKVIDVKGTSVRVQFACDKEQAKEEALWIPYENLTSNYLYAMPAVDNPVTVYYEPNGLLSAIGVHKPPAKAGAKEKSKDGGSGKDSMKPECRTLGSNGNTITFRPDGIDLLASQKGKETMTKIDTKAITLRAKTNVIFSSNGNLQFQAAQGQAMDNQVTLLPAYLIGFGMYAAVGGQPPTAAPASPGGMMGSAPASLKSAGAKLEKPERSELAKEWDKLLHDKKQQAEKEKKKETPKKGAGGQLQMKAHKGLLLKVGDSSISLDGSKFEIKTRTLFQVGMGPAGMPTGSVKSFAGGKPKSRSAKAMNPVHGMQDRKRSKEGGRKTNDSKKISRGK